MQDKLADLADRRDQAINAGSPRSVERQHAKGKMLARERIEYFLDDGSFHELDMLARHRATGLEERPYTDGVITGWGTVEGRKVFVFSQDFTVFGGALGEVFAEQRLMLHKVNTFFHFAVYLATVVTVVLLSFHVSTQVLAVLGGTLAVALGFALKDLAASVVAGILMLFDRPFGTAHCRCHS